jgi:hypothetical protein
LPLAPLPLCQSSVSYILFVCPPCRG